MQNIAGAKIDESVCEGLLPTADFMTPVRTPMDGYDYSVSGLSLRQDF